MCGQTGVPVLSLPGPALAGAGTVSHSVALRCGTELGIEQVAIPCARVYVGIRRHSSIILTCTVTPWVRVGTPSARPTLSLRNIAWCSRLWYIDGRISTKNSPRGLPHWSGSFKFKGPQGGLFLEAPPGEGRAQAVDQVPREASSLKLLREKVNPQKEFAGLSVWQPHTKVNTQRGKRVLSLGGLFCGASWRPPSLPGLFPLGFHFSWH